MGLNIGAAARAVSAYPPTSVNRSDRGSAAREAQELNRQRLIQAPEEPPVQAGFGENTLSPTSAALEALDSNLEAASRLVPTVQELRDRARVNQAARPDAIEARTSTPPTEFRRIESVRPEASPEVRNFQAASEAVAAQRDLVAAPEASTRADTDSAPPDTATARFDIRI